MNDPLSKITQFPNRYDLETYSKLPTAEELVKLRETNAQFENEQKPKLNALFEANVSTTKDIHFGFHFLNNVQNEVFSLPFISESHLEDHQQQLFLLKFFKALFLTAANTENWLNEKDLKPIQSFISEFSKCSIKRIINDSDFDHLDLWIQEAVECQQLFRTYLPSFEPKVGTSKGFLFKILKRGEIRGWLFATMHNIHSPEMLEATKLCGSIYKKLFQCALIATEIKLSGSSLGGDSIENHLLQFARSHGILNLGMDYEDRDCDFEPEQFEKQNLLTNISIDESLLEKTVGNEILHNQLKETIENKKKLTGIMDQLAFAYMQGNADRFIEIDKEVYTDSSPSDLDEKRQMALIKNTHNCLLAMEKVKFENTVPKGFFPYGTSHLLEHKLHSKTIVQGLTELGWDVEPDSI